MDPAERKTILLFYKDFEADSFIPGDRYLKRMLRPVYWRFKKKQKGSGFLISYQLLVAALRQRGYRVHLNDYRLARRHPRYPVGLVGYPHLLDGWSLPNPAILGPALYDHPSIAPDLMNDPRFRAYVATCDWELAMFRSGYGDKCVCWYAGIDTTKWSDTRSHEKSIDVLIYDKVRWDRQRYEPGLIAPLVDCLSRRGLRHYTLRYGRHDHAEYRRCLQQSRSLLFVCEHETQGLAYQEAMASNVPVLAWDNGFWLDPARTRYQLQPVPASSVPYFSDLCGARFRDADEFESVFEKFWDRLDHYQPRRYVEQALSLQGSAELYANHYFGVVD